MSGRQKRQKLKDDRRERHDADALAKQDVRWNARVERGEVVIADLAEQAPNGSYSPPEFYEDQEFVCADCGAEEVWTAAQQKWWYEVAKGSIYSHAIRCRECRKRHREQPQQGQRADRDSPGNPV